MGDYFPEHLRGRASRFKGVGKTRKINSISVAIILMLAMSIFFCAISENYAYADKSFDGYSQFASFKPEYVESISELRDIDLNWENLMANDHCKAIRADRTKKEEVADNEEKAPAMIGARSIKEVVNEELGIMSGLVGEKTGFENNKEESFCGEQHERMEKTENGLREGKMLELVAGYPIEEMLPYIATRSEKVAYYLVAIAKKESDWGKHSPLKYGGTCYNYWGYRGTYNQTDSGYSCFDSPEQAIQQVGDRIEALLDKMIDTPEEMVVWKCGSTCAGHDPQGVLKWISDVKLYYNKLKT